MRIHKVALENWKNFQSADAVLADRVFIVGPNASGKSNFLDAFSFMHDVCRYTFREAVQRRGGIHQIRCLAARRDSNIGIGFELDSQDKDRWSYHLAFAGKKDEPPRVELEIVSRNGRKILARPDAQDKKDPIRLEQTALESNQNNADFRELNDFFESLQYRHLIPQLVRDPAAFTSGRLQGDPYGRDFLNQVETTNHQSKRSRLKQIEKVLKAAVPQLYDLRVERDKYGIPHLYAKYEHWRPHGATQTEAQLSDGTLRLFGLLWTFLEAKSIVLLDEPDLSLHTEIVKLLPEMISGLQRSKKNKGGKQVIISSHSFDLINSTSIAAEEVLRLEPGKEGTKIIQSSEVPEERAAIMAGLTPADIVLPKTRPFDPGQLDLFHRFAD